ncbi:MAG: hypothetical protein PHE02_12525 [Lachnospiraceae bacterium]|nr:hypothetical protein [Lachnospiraceae bacterium]
MIQNNNKYTWSSVRYKMEDGTLSAGMEVKSNGELYGVPRENGTFTFTVSMENGYYSFKSSSRTYTLTVLENTDQNVEYTSESGQFGSNRKITFYLLYANLKRNKQMKNLLENY